MGLERNPVVTHRPPTGGAVWAGLGSMDWLKLLLGGGLSKAPPSKLSLLHFVIQDVIFQLAAPATMSAACCLSPCHNGLIPL